MSVLEDAIREHLELRRRHGAAEDELRDLEAEALGPARREVDEDAEPADAPIEPADEPTRIAEAPVLEEPESEAPFDGAEDEPVLENEPLVADEREHEAEPVPVLDPDEPLPAARLEEPVTEVGSPFDEPYSHEPPAEDLQPEDGPPSEDELSPEEEPPSEEGLPPEEEPPPGDAPAAKDADDDVLEDTPDFLSETPEHDRLWFEQQPPRDFDFD